MDGAAAPDAAVLLESPPPAASAALGGATLYVQVAELEFSVTGGWSGLYTSNGLSVDIGLR